MQQKFLLIANIVLMLLGGLLSLVLQTSFWPQLFGSFPPPILWIPTVVFLSLYRRPLESIILAYFLGVIMIHFTSMPLGVIWFLCFFMFAFVVFIKQRIYLPGIEYFLILTSATGVIYHVLQITISSFAGDVPEWIILDRLLQIIFTPIPAVPIYYFYNWIDRITAREPLIETQENN